jgi:hypothetical protein
MIVAMNRLHVVLLAPLLLSFGCSHEPFAMAPVSGKVTYEDGSLVPIELLCVVFTSQSEPVDSKTHPRPATASVDKATGAIHSVTTHKFNDGLVRGKHKVTFGILGGGVPPASLVPPEYIDPARTPLEVDTASQPFELKVRKPTK